MDGRITSDRGKSRPPGGSARRAKTGASLRGRVPSVPEAGSSIHLTAGAENQNISLLSWRSPVELWHPPCRTTAAQGPNASYPPDYRLCGCPGEDSVCRPSRRRGASRRFAVSCETHTKEESRFDRECRRRKSRCGIKRSCGSVVRG
jgi:hypothetical protein